MKTLYKRILAHLKKTPLGAESLAIALALKEKPPTVSRELSRMFREGGYLTRVETENHGLGGKRYTYFPSGKTPPGSGNYDPAKRVIPKSNALGDRVARRVYSSGATRHANAKVPLAHAKIRGRIALMPLVRL